MPILIARRDFCENAAVYLFLDDLGRYVVNSYNLIVGLCRDGGDGCNRVDTMITQRGQIAEKACASA